MIVMTIARWLWCSSAEHGMLARSARGWNSVFAWSSRLADVRFRDSTSSRHVGPNYRPRRGCGCSASCQFGSARKSRIVLVLLLLAFLRTRILLPPKNSSGPKWVLDIGSSVWRREIVIIEAKMGRRSRLWLSCEAARVGQKRLQWFNYDWRSNGMCKQWKISDRPSSAGGTAVLMSVSNIKVFGSGKNRIQR